MGWKKAMNATPSVNSHSTGQPGILRASREQPNLPEVSGTSFPLLTTVLAGFAVTIAVQLILNREAPDALTSLVSISIVIFLASSLAFISSIVFAVNAQAYNYLPFLGRDDSRHKVFGVEDHAEWIRWLHQGWDSFHLASILTFYGGIALLLAGVNLIVLEFVGPVIGLVVLLLIIGISGSTVAITFAVHHRKNSFADPGDEHVPPELQANAGEIAQQKSNA